MSVKRYRYDFQSGLVADDKGGLVSYADYEKLASENAGLKDAISCHAAGFTVCEACGEENISGNDDVCRALNETPATDAFLAEVRAQGVEMCSAEIQKQTWDEREGDGMVAAIDAMEIYALQLRKGVQS
ncbi:hypothetical protein JJQ50_08315 [Enterobacter cloacae]|uniref:hypothetical protein n=1 Tax=Enterobacter TaxID=547 RepID=UPI000D1D1BFE|nr:MULTISPECIES: hypothetical protein [Enterobacter]MBJ6383845.1 hypothetical protein [Enterobacter cloacae]MBJ6402948.1 hypothetical protein [Enterobacter cloacae]MBJ6432814.1 hypothetical protein [Enterobacter cloacae]MBJ6459425.1 hypothetical protein [Enterobacter cloacae]MBJ6486327.1 hypothetical protein [Enterobacter cloacae]